ncbi:MAG TPA: hypothetical protein VGD69_22950 [Herpetosiphonaceae bacterium]
MMMKQPVAGAGRPLARAAVLLVGMALGFVGVLAFPGTDLVHSFTGTVAIRTENGVTCVRPSDRLLAWSFVYVLEIADNSDGTVCAVTLAHQADDSVTVGTAVRAGVSWLSLDTEESAKRFVFISPESP